MRKIEMPITLFLRALRVAVRSESTDTASEMVELLVDADEEENAPAPVTPEITAEHAANADHWTAMGADLGVTPGASGQKMHDALKKIIADRDNAVNDAKNLLEIVDQLRDAAGANPGDSTETVVALIASRKWALERIRRSLNVSEDASVDFMCVYIEGIGRIKSTTDDLYSSFRKGKSNLSEYCTKMDEALGYD